MKKLITRISIMVLCIHVHAQTGKVGINTANPQQTLHVAGGFRVDSLKKQDSAVKVISVDALGNFGYVMKDSLLKNNIYYSENNSLATNSSSALQVRITLELPAGSYLLFAYCEAYNSSIPSGVRVRLDEGATEVAYGAMYSDVSTFCPWGTFRYLTLASTKTYSLLWGSWPNGNPAIIRRARLCAIKIG